MNNRLISMSDATRLCSYDQEYLSLLARRGMIKAKKVGGKWYTTVNWLNEYIAEKRPNELISSVTAKSLGLHHSLISTGNVIRLLLLAVLMVGSLMVSYWLANFYSDLRAGGDTSPGIRGNVNQAVQNMKQAQVE